MTDPYAINNPNVPVPGHFYDCHIKCDSSTKVFFKGLEQFEVLQLMELTRTAFVYKDYTEPKITNVSLVVSAHEVENGSTD